jgi:hypothetical protein
MQVKKYLKKRLDIEQLSADINSREVRGIHFHKKGYFDQDFDIIELIVGRGIRYTYSFKIYLQDGIIMKIERVKFEWECGGWRSDDHLLKRFPLQIECEKLADEILSEYLTN